MTGRLRRHSGRAAAGAALALVAACAGVISYSHIDWLTVALHQSPLVGHLMPLAVDGLVIVGAVVLLEPPPGEPWLGWLGVAPGVAASLFANIESGIRHGWLAAMWAGVPAAAFALATFMLERWLKGQVSRGDPGGPASAVPRASPLPARPPPAPPPDGAVPCPHGAAPDTARAVILAYLHGRDCLAAAPSQRQLAAQFSMSRNRVALLVRQAEEEQPAPVPV